MINNIKGQDMRKNKYGKMEKVIGVSFELELIKEFEEKLFKDRKTKKEIFLEAIKKYLKED